MAVYTNLNFNEISQIISEYDIGNIINYKEIIEGIENTNFLIETSQNKFILTIFEGRVANEDIIKFVELMLYSSEYFNCPKPLANKAACYINEAKQKKYIITSFVKGQPFENTDQITVDKCLILGELLAKFHTQHLEAKWFKRKNTMGPKIWKELMKETFSIIKDPDNNQLNKQKISAQKIIQYENIYETSKKMQELWHLDLKQKELPRGIIHADLFIDNVFFNANDKNYIGVIDFYFCCHDYFVYDLATTITAWCFNGNVEFLPNRFKQILKGYQKIRPLNENEKKYLNQFLVAACIRFFSTRFYDYYKSYNKEQKYHKKNPDEYLEKFNFFNSENFASQLSKI